MLALDVTRIRTAEEHFEKVYKPEAVAAGEADVYRITAPVSLVFDIVRKKDVFELRGRVQTTLELECGRCLEPFALPVDATFDLRYQPQPKEAGEPEREVGADDLTTAYYEDDAIDLGQLMREQFYLALPMKPLCAETCRGLCSICGTNLNRDTCTCVREWEDPRLAALKALTHEPQTRH